MVILAYLLVCVGIVGIITLPRIYRRTHSIAASLVWLTSGFLAACIGLMVALVHGQRLFAVIAMLIAGLALYRYLGRFLRLRAAKTIPSDFDDHP